MTSLINRVPTRKHPTRIPEILTRVQTYPKNPTPDTRNANSGITYTRIEYPKRGFLGRNSPLDPAARGAVHWPRVADKRFWGHSLSSTTSSHPIGPQQASAVPYDESTNDWHSQDYSNFCERCGCWKDLAHPACRISAPVSHWNSVIGDRTDRMNPVADALTA